MSSLPLELHDVLEGEYVSMYGPLPRPSREYDVTDILDHDWACVILRECGRAANGKAVAQELSTLVVGDGSLQFLISSPAITERGKILLEDYDDYAALAAKQGGKIAVEELRRGIVDKAFTGAVKPLRDIRLDNVYAALHMRAKEGKPRTALCISGGGIRSATFALGVIQGLASANILDRFDYLSTVSGGGYIGSWLSSWVRRHRRGVTGVKEDLQRADTAIAESRPAVARAGAPTVKRDLPERKVNPEPEPLRHLREYSNYLSPRLGLFSGDTWTLASLYIRNLLLNLLVLIPLLALALAFPRIFSCLLDLRGDRVLLPPVAWAWIAAVLTTVGCAYLGHKRPVEQGERAQTKAGTSTSSGSFILGCVLPLIGAAVALAVFWARAKQPENEGLLTDPWTYGAAALAFLGMTLVPYVLYYRRYWRSLAAERRTSFAPAGDLRKVHRKANLKKQLREGTALLVAVLTTFALLWLLAVKVFDEPLRPVPIVETMPPIDRANVPASPQAQLYASFAVPLVLLVFYLQASIFVGLSGPVNADSDREWWGRAGGWLLAFAAGLAILNAIAVFGPVAFYYAPAILASIGGGAGIAAALLGYSDKTAAKKEDAGTAAKAINLASVLMVPLFIAALLAVISLGSTWLIQQLTDDDRIIQASRYKQQALLQARFKTSEQTKAGMETLATTPSPRVSIPALKATAHLQTVQHTSGTQVLTFLAVGALAVVLSLFIGVNKFSMHSLYRNRIIRAYLGASRYQRDPDRFTGFDENDNLQMWELRPELLWPVNLRDVKALIGALQDRDNKLGSYLWSLLEQETKDAIAKSIDAISAVTLVQNLNAILLTGDLAASGVKVPEWISADPDQIGYPLVMRNRAILDEQLARWIVQMPPPADAQNAPKTDIRRGPVHVVNTALNLTSGENLAWQQRMAESFTVSPFHTGSLFLGFRPSREYGGDDGISLGTAVTISGAAASPNMGYHSSPTMAFLLTIFNIRLGSWLGNPGPHGQTSFDKGHPTTTLIPLFAELTGSSNSKSKWVYLSDGGHFENLALYEMVVRRCHRIVLSDGGADPSCTFEDLGNAIRKIRTDLGIPIDIRKITMAPRAKDGKPVTGEYVAFATIRYSAVDEAAQDGELIYIKPGVYSDEYFPYDVYNYAMESLAFPHEPTSDQFFSESQFESYRALGRHAVNQICKNYPPPGPGGARIPIAKTYSSVDEFAKRVAEGEKPQLPQPEAASA